MFGREKVKFNPIFALIVGVDQYLGFDPEGGANLPGAANDAASWEVWCRESLHLLPQQLRVLTGQAADRSGMVAGLQWLGQQVARNPDRSALFTFSGHGLTVGKRAGVAEGMTLALGPADITPDLEQALTFAQIELILSEAIAEEMFGSTELTASQRASVRQALGNITAVLDCCYTQPEGVGGTLRSLTRAPVRTVDPNDVQVFSRQLLACELWEVAWEIRAHGRWHGAFTWSLLTMLGQWSLGSDDETRVRYSRASYGDLVFRTRELVQTLGLPGQKPTLLGDVKNLSLLPFLRPGAALHQGWTSPDPDGPRQGEEFSSGIDTQFKLTFYGTYNVSQQSTSNMIATYAKDGDDAEWTFYPDNILGAGAGGVGPGVWSYAINPTTPPPSNPQPTGVFEDKPSWTQIPSVPSGGYQANGTQYRSAPNGTNANSNASPSWAVQFQWIVQTGQVTSVFTYMYSSPSPPPSDATVNLTGAQPMIDMQGTMYGNPGGWYGSATEVS